MNFTTLHSFNIPSPNTATNDGNYPLDGLAISRQHPVWDDAAYAGPTAFGTIFALNTDGTGYTILSAFDRLSDTLTNSEEFILGRE